MSTPGTGDPEGGAADPAGEGGADGGAARPSSAGTGILSLALTASLIALTLLAFAVKLPSAIVFVLGIGAILWNVFVLVSLGRARSGWFAGCLAALIVTGAIWIVAWGLVVWIDIGYSTGSIG